MNAQPTHFFTSVCSPRLFRVVVCAAIVAGGILTTSAIAQEPAMHAGKLAHELDRLANTGRVLYVAAHPDDENTRLLAYLANRRHVTAAYLSMTRGGGGQNLIGPEQAELLDVIRTEELLAARRLDAAAQRFTRMRDFGYSKSADETLRIWGREEALADVVWVIRSFRPDVIIARFDENPPNHGHHTASAILAREAFAAAADAARFPEQLALGVEPWQADRLLRNVSHWREIPPPPEALPVEVGGYDARLGLAYGELAAHSRSQHKSQGFGVAGERGSIVERFVHVAGSRPEADLLDGIDLTWKRFGAAGAAFAAALDAARAALDRDHAEKALPALLEAHAAAAALPNAPRVLDARAALDRFIADATGLFVRATAAHSGAVPGTAVPVTVEFVAPTDGAMQLRRVVFPDGHGSGPVDLPHGAKREISHDVAIPDDAAISSPYWLQRPVSAGRQSVADVRMIGAPAGPPALQVRLEIAVGDRTLLLDTPVVFAWTDRVHGERIRDFQIVPPATVTATRDAVMFANGATASVTLRLRAGRDDVHGTVALGLPDGWASEPLTSSVHLSRVGSEQLVRFAVTPPAGAAAIEIAPLVTVDGRAWSLREDVIDYEHIPVQRVLRPASLRLVPLALQLAAGPVGYIRGSGDSVADDLRSVGLDVEMLDEEAVRGGDLSRYAAVLVGIRAYNTSEAVRNAHARLMRYVEDGGTVVVQYNTHSRWSPLDTPLGPYPLQIGSGRVTDETAEMRPVAAAQAVLLRPNEITAVDFDNWVQERGLYFAETWDERYQPVFAAADRGEDELLGSTLVAEHGKGRYVYTGLAFFRQLPAGVPGAYRLLANFLAGEEP